MKTANLAIVFTDIKGFTERTSRQTLEQNQTLLKTHHDLLAPVFRAFGGRIIKEIGDAFLVTFESPTQAVLAGVALQDRLWQHNRARSGDERLEVRVAINVGEVRVEHGDVFGEPVNIAARVEGITGAGEVYLTEAVYLSMNKAEVPAEEVGPFELKGIPGKIKVYRVPHAPYRVEPAISGTAAPPLPAGDDSPPYGNLGLSKMPDTPGAELTAKAVQLTAAAMAGGEDLVKRAVQGVSNLEVKRSLSLARRLAPAAAAVVALVLFGFVLRAVFSSGLEGAMGELAAAPATEKSAKYAAAKARVDEVKAGPERSYWTGRLAEANGEEEVAIGHYAKAVRDGDDSGEQRLARLLEHPKCGTRVAALGAISGLKLKSARARVAALAEKGGPGDGERVLIFAGCDSKRSAAKVLAELGE